MAITARIRFGALPSSLVPSRARDTEFSTWCDFRDTLTQALVDVSGVTCRVWLPGGSLLDPALTPVEVTEGTWRLDLDPALSGLYKIEFACTTPSEGSDARSVLVTATEPDEGPPPDLTYPEVQTLVARAEAAAADAEAAAGTAAADVAAEVAADAARAEAAQLAAESAVSTGTGPLYATSVVAATLDGNGRATNYTCVLPRTIQTGSVVKIAFPTTSGTPGVTIRPTVSGVLQPFYGLRQNSGSQILDGFFASGVTYSFVYDGTVMRAESRAISTEIVQPTGHQMNYRAPGDANARHRDWPLDDGRRFWYSGDGTVAPTVRFGILADGSVRAYSGMRIDGTATVGTARILTENDAGAPLTSANIKHIVGAPSRMNNRTSPQRTSVAAYYQVGGIDQHRDIIYANGAMINFVHAPKGATFNLIPASAGAVCHLYTGEGDWSGNGSTAATLTANSWVNDGSKMLTGSAGAWIRVRRGNNTFLAIADSGTVGTASGAVMPAADLVLGVGPQSWGVDLQMNGAADAVDQLGLLGLGTKFHSVPTAAVGASSLLYFADKATLSYWNAETDTPTQRLDDMIAAIQADRTTRTALQGSTAPAMSVMVWYEGLNLMGFWGPQSTHPYNCPQAYTASMVKVFQYINAQLGYNLTYIVIPLTSQKLGTFAESLWHAVRMAQLRAPAAGAAASPSVDIIVAPEVYGDPRSGDEEAESGERHYDFPAQGVQMRRIIDAWANHIHAQTNHLGTFVRPTDPVVTADGGAGVIWDVVLNYGDGRAFSSAPVPHLAGFRLLPAATGNIDVDDFATPLTIASVSWAGAGGAPLIALRVTLASAYTAGTPRPSVLWGAAPATDDLDTLIYTLSPVNAKRVYLRQFLSGG
jgi:hypothetical protein